MMISNACLDRFLKQDFGLLVKNPLKSGHLRNTCCTHARGDTKDKWSRVLVTRYSGVQRSRRVDRRKHCLFKNRLSCKKALSASSPPDLNLDGLDGGFFVMSELRSRLLRSIGCMSTIRFGNRKFS